MAENDKNVWGMHAGATGDADTLFLKQNYIGLGWAKIGDLKTLSANRETFKMRVASAYPEMKLGAIPVNAGQLYRFVHEMRVGDLVAYPSKQDRQIHIGQVIGEYQYNPSLESGYPHLRQVKWLKSVPRTHFTQGALYEIGSAMSFFLLKAYVDEYKAAVEAKASTEPLAGAEDETVALVAEDIEQLTRDFILKQLSQELKGHPLAHFVAHLLQKIGYHTRVSPEGADGGIDIIAHKDELGFEPPIIKVQVKSGTNIVSPSDVQALYGTIEGGKSEYGLFVTLSSFSSQAKIFARSKSNLRLIDGTDLVDLVLQYYDHFDSRYKALLPLKRVYIPQALQDDES